MTKGESLEERLELAKNVGFDGVDFDDAASVTPKQLQKAVNSTGTFVHNVINHAHWKQRLTNSDPKDRSIAVANLKHCLEVSHAAGGSAVLIVIGKADDGPRGIEVARTEIQTLLPLAAKLGQRILFENVWNGLFYDPNGPRDQSVQPFNDYIDSFQSPWIGAYFDLGNHARFANVATWIRDLGTRIVKLDIKGYSNEKADKEGVRKGFVDITDGDIDWKSVRKALSDIRFTGWVAAEVGGGDADRFKTCLRADETRTPWLSNSLPLKRRKSHDGFIEQKTRSSKFSIGNGGVAYCINDGPFCNWSGTFRAATTTCCCRLRWTWYRRTK